MARASGAILTVARDGLDAHRLSDGVTVRRDNVGVQPEEYKIQTYTVTTSNVALFYADADGTSNLAFVGASGEAVARGTAVTSARASRVARQDGRRRRCPVC